MPFVNSARGVFGAQSGVTSAGLILDLITGGTITTSGDYRIHTFTQSGSFSTYTTLPIEYLVVGGGGNGYIHPTYSGGGGGGGQVLTGSMNLGVPATVVVGGPLSFSEIRNPGVFTAITAASGGSAPRPGSGDDRAGGASGNGNIGAIYSNSGYTGGGGGGAGGAATQYPVSPTLAQNGGIGVESNITGTAVFYGGGGAGGAVNRPPYPGTDKCGWPTTLSGWSYPYGTGGQGGGGAAPDNPGSYNGKPGTGGGACGSSAYGFNTQHTGGPGIVVIRYRYK